MSYVALYRKWRPDNFDEVKGQDHIVKTLRNQVTHQRVGHAYLFCGTRGTGKTTLAKILAKAVNCEHPVNGNPCNECPTCKAIANGQNLSVIEIDAASNNGVENIRQIKNAVEYSPSDSKYMVYIIDEVHMLSGGAFNALLKTLEEPPEYVIFILATTESHKIPATILSRCQKYDFKRIDKQTIANRLEDLLQREDVKATREALLYIAKMADGSMRDALSILDQCIAFNLGEELTYDKVIETIGSVDVDIYVDLLRYIYAGDVTNSLQIIDKAIMDGKDLTQFVNEFIVFVRNVLVLKINPDILLDMTKENTQKLIELGKDMSENYLIDCVGSLQESSSRISMSNTKKVMLEMAIIRLCKPIMQENYGALEKRVEDLENRESNILKEIQDMPNYIANAAQNPAQYGTDANGIQNMQNNVYYADGAVIDGDLREPKPDKNKKIGDPRKVAQNIERKYEPAKVSELKLIASMHEEILKNLPPVSAKYFARTILEPTSEIGRMDLAIADTKENTGEIAFFDDKKHIEGIEACIEELFERKVKLRVRKVSEEVSTELANWDLAMLDTTGLDFRVEH